jgi:pSer/pThr/pTyr-binding forkhead associated (FHA) protein
MPAAAEKASKTPTRIPTGARVVVRQGFYEGLELPIDGAWLVLGRGATADWSLAEVTLSRSHAAFGWDGADFFVQDLGSTNGTLVNGAREERAQLRDGDEVQIGKLVLRVSLPSPRAMATPRSVP